MHEDDWDEDDDLEIVEVFEPFDVICYRTPPNRMDGCSVTWCNLTQFIVHHSPTGFEWGYGGSGPNELALNILHMHLPAGIDGQPPVKLHRGFCSQVAWNLHNEFCREFIAPLPDAGGVIKVEEVQAWIGQRWSPSTGYADERFNIRFPRRAADQEQARDTEGGPDL